MRLKIIITVFCVLVAGIIGTNAFKPGNVKKSRSVPTAYEGLYLRERRFGKADDDIDGLIALAAVEEIEKEPDPDRIFLGLYWITGYDLCVQCCGVWSAEHPRWQGTDYVQTTASGVPNKVGVTVAAGPELPFGTKIYIDGIGERIVQDRGVGNGCVDVLCNNHAECAEVTGWREVWLIP